MGNDQPLSLMRLTRQLIQEYLGTDKIKGWQIIGDIIIINIPKELEYRKTSIGNALLKLYPRCKSVLMNKGISGEFRIPERELIAGIETETIHKEHGCFFKLDASKIMFAKGNLLEKMRMSSYGDNEVVIDMFAGIGYFSIPIAVHSRPKKIISIELNPIAFHYLKENIKLNKVENIIKPILGNCKYITPVKVADRVIMGYIKTTHHFLKPAILALKSGGVLHYHETTPKHLIPARPIQRIKKVAEELGSEVKILKINKVKKYAPGILHIVVDARVH
ncbi:MAG TPA: class I SAM-dependent methyltransferase family protein [Methanosarcinales archaeon]|nr:class I SAM-dependent methyltransferase family protein [Methanosarcinales archaeon]